MKWLSLLSLLSRQGSAAARQARRVFVQKLVLQPVAG